MSVMPRHYSVRPEEWQVLPPSVLHLIDSVTEMACRPAWTGQDLDTELGQENADPERRWNELRNA